jgi:arginase family enzyme
MNKTIVKSLSFIGAAISEGQSLAGVKQGPDIVRKSGVFETLKHIYNLTDIRDYGNISVDSVLQT